MLLKADRALSKLNLLFLLKTETNLVTLKKCNSHLQYYKIDLNFSIKLQKINLNVCEEYKTERNRYFMCVYLITFISSFINIRRSHFDKMYENKNQNFIRISYFFIY